MVQKSLFDFSKKPKKNIEKEKSLEVTIDSSSAVISEKKTIEKRKKHSKFPPVSPDELPPSYFVSAKYNGQEKKVVIKYSLIMIIFSIEKALLKIAVIIAYMIIMENPTLVMF